MAGGGCAGSAAGEYRVENERDQGFGLFPAVRKYVYILTGRKLSLGVQSVSVTELKLFSKPKSTELISYSVDFQN